MLEKIGLDIQQADQKIQLKYGENPHQKGIFYSNSFKETFEIIHGERISFSNVIDIDSAVRLMDEFTETSFAILKHSNPIGFASRNELFKAWTDAMACDPVSAYGGILITNGIINLQTAEEIHKMDYVCLIAKEFEENAIELLKNNSEKLILKQRKSLKLPELNIRSALGGFLIQEADNVKETEKDLKVVTKIHPNSIQTDNLLIANKIVKHTRTSSIALVKDKQLVSIAISQTSRFDAIRDVLNKAEAYGFDLNGASLASEASLPYIDIYKLAHQVGISSIIQPGGAELDQEAIAFCDEMNICMAFTGYRHFKH